MKYIKVDSIINEYLSHAGDQISLDTSKLKRYADFLVSKMPYMDKYTTKVKLLEVKDYQVDKPGDLEYIVQVAFCENKTHRVKRTEVVEWVQKSYDGSGCEVTISMNCTKCKQVKCNCASPEIIVDVDRMWELNHPEFKYGHMAWYYRHGGLGNDNVPISPIIPTFSLIGPTRDTFFNADMHIKGCLNLGRGCSNTPIKYKVEDTKFRFNAKDGYVLLSYLAVPTCDEGYRLIPDVPELIEAITWYIDERLSYIEYKASRDETYLRDFKNAEAEKNKFIGIAREKLLTQDYHEFQRDLGAFYGKYLPHEDIHGNTTDLFHTVMSSFSNK